jgi:multiple sugar transport system permease protein
MATIDAVTRRAYVATPRRGPITRLLEDERWLASCLLLPTIVLLGLFIAYPFIEGVRLAVTDTKVGIPGKFVGIDNFVKLWHDDIFRVAVYNTFLYTFVTTIFKLALGLWLALLLNRHFKGKAMVRAAILLPFIIPTVLSTFAWKWMFDPTFSVINYLWLNLGLFPPRMISLVSSILTNFPHWRAIGIDPHVTPWFGGSRINWLGDPNLAIISVMIVNIWRGVPFYAISLLAGLQTISPELHEAAAIDGARPWQRFRHVTWPLLLPVTMVVVLFSVIQTFADFQLVYVLTGGGPANATHLFATYAYQIGVGTGLLSEGAAVSLAIFPVLLLVVIIQLIYIRRVETI